jgi:hypothetical protein
MRNMRAGVPPCTVVSAAAMKGRAASLDVEGWIDQQCQQIAGRGPAIDTCAHWSVTETNCTSSSGPQHLMQNCMCW